VLVYRDATAKMTRHSLHHSSTLCIPMRKSWYAMDFMSCLESFAMLKELDGPLNFL
jgi:hypothetical protein